MYLESENEENDDIDFEYDNEAFYKICIVMIQVMMKTSYRFDI